MSDTPSGDAATQARLLAKALPYMQRYENRTIVVKYGGNAMGDASLGQAFAQDIALLKQSGVNPSSFMAAGRKSARC
jgi:acetylglutamate kinase